MKKSDYELIIKKINELEKKLNGGKGSGNFGHYGRPGEVGGSSSSPSAGYSIESISERTMLRDYGDEEQFPYLDDEHKKLCDIADYLYNANLEDEEAEKYLKPDYKELYDKYGRDFFHQVTEDMAGIDSQITGGSNDPHFQELVADYMDKLNEKKSDGVKGGTKAEHEAYVKLITDYYDGDERGFKGALEDARAGGMPGESNYQKALKSVEGGNFGISYDDCYRDLKSIYGKQFKESTYLTKDGEYKYKDGEPYVWKIYKAKIAKALADEMDKEDRK